MTVVVLASPGPLTDSAVGRIHKEKPVAAVLLEKRSRPPGEKLRWWLFDLPARRGLAYALDRLAFVVYERLFLRGAQSAELAAYLSRIGSVPGLPPGVPVHEVSSVNSPEALALLDRLAPDVILVMGTSIVKEPTIKKARRMMLNIHCGITPEYRGGGNFHALCRGDMDNVGVTIHEVDAGIDTGRILYQEKIPFDPVRDTLFGHYLRCVERGNELFLKAIGDLERGAEKPFTRPAKDGFFPSHTLSQYLRLKRRLGRRAL